MADFYQHGTISTLHDLTNRSYDDLEADLLAFSLTRPIALVLPSLFSELEGPALGNIVEELSRVRFLRKIIIGLDRADEAEFRHAQHYFSRLPQNHRILWNDGPRLKALDEELAAHNLAPLEPGKGRNVWYCFGYAIASHSADVVALHDCDILGYHRSLLARLVYPVANPTFRYVFCKGYYPRIDDEKMNGRVTRLLVTPLLHAMKKVCTHTDYLDYLANFRYPLAGEFAMRMNVVPDIRIPSDWGLELGILAEIWRTYTPRAICQTAIADRYDHKHQPVSDDDPATGLSKMSTDIAKSIFRKLAIDGEIFSSEKFRTLKATYLRTALDMVEVYQNDATMNGLSFDRHREEMSVELFASNIVEAGKTFLETPHEAPFIPSWSRIHAAIPDFLPRLYEAVQVDNMQP